MSPGWVGFLAGAIVWVPFGFLACALLSIGPRQEAIGRAFKAGRLAERKKTGRRGMK